MEAPINPAAALCPRAFAGPREERRPWLSTPESDIIHIFPRPPNVPLLRAIWSVLDGIWGVLKGSWGVLVNNHNNNNNNNNNDNNNNNNNNTYVYMRK